MDTYHAITSRRDVKSYDGRPLDAGVLERILDAGRLSGSAKNRQPWRFVVVESPDRREDLAEAVYEPTNVRGAAAVVAVISPGSGAAFDCGRAVQSMLLAAWNDGVASTPNGLADRDAARETLGLDGDEQIQIVLTFGYPARVRDPGSRTPAEWSRAANRKTLDEVVDTV